MVKPEDSFVTAPPDRQFRFGREWNSASKNPYLVDVLVIRTTDGQHFLRDVEPTIWGPQEDSRVVSLLNANGEEKVRELLEIWYSDTRQRFDDLARDVAENRAGRPQWEFFDFCYFSTITLTTLGYGDIVPNSRWARMLVMCQAFFGIGYIAFNIQLLWRENNSSSRTAS
jgi:hypothetical protein